MEKSELISEVEHNLSQINTRLKILEKLLVDEFTNIELTFVNKNGRRITVTDLKSISNIFLTF